MIKAYIDTFKRYRFLLGNLISRDLKVKYRRSVLGLIWSLLNPILMMLILSAVFSTLMRGATGVENYPLYIITGQTLYTFFNEATSSALESIVGSSALLKKIYVPKYVFPLEKVLFAFVNLGFSMIAVLIILPFYRLPLSFTMLLAPIPLLLLMLFALGVGLLLSALYAFFRDVKHLYSVIILAWMYLTPVIYPIEILNSDGALVSLARTVVHINPLTWYVDYFRTVFLNGSLPNLEMNLICCGWSVLMLALGLFVFRKTQDRFILHI